MSNSNSAPVAVNDVLTVRTGVERLISAIDLMGGDSVGPDNDYDNDSVAFANITITRAPSAQQGWLTNDGQRLATGSIVPSNDLIVGNFRFVPASNFTGSSEFRYRVSDGALTSNEARVTLNVLQRAADDFSADVNTQGHVSVNGSISAEIERPQDVDWLSVTMQRGVRYQIDVEGSRTGGGTLRDPSLVGVYDASGRLINNTRDDDSGDGQNAQLSFVASSSGTHFIAASGFGLYTGSYQVSVSGDQSGAVPSVVTPVVTAPVVVPSVPKVSEPTVNDDYAADRSTSGRLQVNQSVSGQIEQGKDSDWFAVTLEAGHRYQIDLEGKPTDQGSVRDTFLRGIYDANGKMITGTSDDDGGISVNSQVVFTADKSATYYISAGAYGSYTGSYSLSIEEQEQPASGADIADNADTSGRVEVNGYANGDIERSHDIDWFAINLRAGERYQIDLEGSASGQGTLSDPYFNGIFDSQSRLIRGTSNDDGGIGRNAQLEFVAEHDGLYFMSASAYGNHTGSYRLGVADDELPAAEEILSSQPSLDNLLGAMLNPNTAVSNGGDSTASVIEEYQALIRALEPSAI